MPELNFKGKEFVYNHHLTVPFRPLEPQADKGIGEPSLDGNLIIHGDNLHALKALMPMYVGEVDCFYIDPPYNTGKKDWSYSDRIDAPFIKEWLEDNPIDKDDVVRHDKWLTMMWPRLSLIRDLLKPGGILFVSIDENEVARAKEMLTEILGDNSHLGTIIWKNATDNNPTNIAIEHEYVLVFAAHRDKVEPVWKSPWSDLKDVMEEVAAKILAEADDLADAQANYADWFKAHKKQLGPLAEYNRIDADGIYTASRSVHNPGKEGYRWELENPKTGKPVPQPLMGYRFPEETRDKLLAEERIIFSDKEDQLIRLKLPLKEYQEKMPSLIEIDGRRGANELRKLFPDRKQPFKNPKTYTLIEWLLSYVADASATIVDSFAGSGTTAHAVIELNRRDGGQRRFILAEGEDYADDLTAERVRRVIKESGDSTETFTYCELGDSIDMDGLLTGDDLPQLQPLASLLYHTATSQAFDASELKAAPDIGEGVHRLGTAIGRHLWLFYKPDLDWLKSGEAALTLSKARAIAETEEGEHLVFSPAKFVSRDLLNSQNIRVEYAPLPYALYRVETA